MDSTRLTIWTIKSLPHTNIEKGRVVIGNVNAGGHFVLLTGYASDNDTFYVNDPGYSRASYSYKTDLVGYRIFDMK